MPAVSGRTYTIIDPDSGLVLDATNDKVIVNPLIGTDAQKWTLTYTGDGWTLKCKADGRYLGLPDGDHLGSQASTVDQSFHWYIRDLDDQFGLTPDKSQPLSLAAQAQRRKSAVVMESMATMWKFEEVQD